MIKNLLLTSFAIFIISCSEDNKKAILKKKTKETIQGK